MKHQPVHHCRERRSLRELAAIRVQGQRENMGLLREVTE
jgi:hypothetical protein